MARLSHRFEWWPVERVTEPQDYSAVRIARNAWWVVNDKGEVLIYRHPDAIGVAPQMNPSESIARRIGSQYDDGYDVVQIPLAFYPIDVKEY